MSSDDGYQMTITINQPPEIRTTELRNYASHPFAYRLYGSVKVRSVVTALVTPDEQMRTYSVYAGESYQHFFNPFKSTVKKTAHDRLIDNFHAACRFIRGRHNSRLGVKGKKLMIKNFNTACDKIHDFATKPQKSTGANRNLASVTSKLK